MTTPVNPVRPQGGPAVFGAICLYGAFVAVRQMAETRIGTEPWWAGIVLLGMAVAGFAVIEGLWLYAQREVTFTTESVIVRRWIAVGLGKPGVEWLLTDLARSSVSVEGGQFRITRQGSVVLNMQLWYWGRRHVANLVRAFEERSIPVHVRWPGAMPQ